MKKKIPGGLGLNNVKKRLEILYRGNFKLETQKMQEIYVINLELNLERLEKQYSQSLELTKII